MGGHSHHINFPRFCLSAFGFSPCSLAGITDTGKSPCHCPLPAFLEPYSSCGIKLQPVQSS